MIELDPVASAHAEEILQRRQPDVEAIWLTAEDRRWIVMLLDKEIKHLRGSGRKTMGAQWARDLRRLRARIKGVENSKQNSIVKGAAHEPDRED